MLFSSLLLLQLSAASINFNVKAALAFAVEVNGGDDGAVAVAALFADVAAAADFSGVGAAANAAAVVAACQ